MGFKTADLCDEFEALVQVAEPMFEDYGGARSFYGQIATVRADSHRPGIRGQRAR